MKTLFLGLLTTALSFSFTSCNASGKTDGNTVNATETEDTSVTPDIKEVDVSDAKGYYLQNEKIYFYDFANEKSSVLNISDKPIIDFWLSPKSEYIAYVVEHHTMDCVSYSSIGIYDIAKKKTIETFGADKDRPMMTFQGWQTDKKIFFTETDVHEEDAGEDDFTYTSYEYTVGGKAEKLPGLAGDMGLDIDTVESMNKDYTTRDDEDGIHLIKTPGEEKIIQAEDGDIQFYGVLAWLNKSAFLFSARHIDTSGLQCSTPLVDVYLYDLNAGKTKLIMRNALSFQIVK